MAQVIINIPDNQVPRLATAMKALRPIPMIDNPEYNEETNPDVEPQIPEFTDGQWGQRCIVDWLKSQVKRYEQAQAKKAIVVDSVDDIAS